MIHREMNIGNGFLILYLTPSKAVFPPIPEPLKVLEVLPDYTLGGFFGALYHSEHNITDPSFNIYKGVSGQGFALHQTVQGPGSFLEFGIITALTRCPAPDGTGRCNKKKGFYLNPAKPVKGPELLWEYRKDGISICGKEGLPPCISLNVKPITPRIPLTLRLTFIEMKGEGVIFDRILPVTKPAISFSSIHIPSSSPLSGLPFKSKIFSLIFSLNHVVAEEPDTIKRKVFKELKTGVYGRII